MLQDGRECDAELEAVADARKKLVESGVFTLQVRVDVVDVHKTYAKNLRLWNRNSKGKIERDIYFMLTTNKR